MDNSFIPPDLPNNNNINLSNNQQKVDGKNLWLGIAALISYFLGPIIYWFFNVTIGSIISIFAFVAALITILTNPHEEKQFLKPVWKYKNKAKALGICTMSLIIVEAVIATVGCVFFFFGIGTTVVQKVTNQTSRESQTYADNGLRPINDENDLRDGEIMITIDGQNYAQELDFGSAGSIVIDSYEGYQNSNNYSENTTANTTTYNSNNDYTSLGDRIEGMLGSDRDSSSSATDNKVNNYITNENNENNTYTTNTTQDDNNLEIGDTITFGNYNWKVLDIKPNQALIITEYPIGQGRYNSEFKEITWENSSLRNYLNGDFYNGFSDKEKEKIIEVLNDNPNNEQFGTNGGNSTLDKLFILSTNEAERYNIAIPEYVMTNAIYWLRTPGDDGKFAAGVYGSGIINEEGYNVDGYAGVRPACWIKIDT